VEEKHIKPETETNTQSNNNNNNNNNNSSYAYVWSEKWPLNRTERRKTETAEVRFLRSATGYALIDHIRNTECITNIL
jgi:hypothetical protein